MGCELVPGIQKVLNKGDLEDGMHREMLWSLFSTKALKAALKEVGVGQQALPSTGATQQLPTSNIQLDGQGCSLPAGQEGNLPRPPRDQLVLLALGAAVTQVLSLGGTSARDPPQQVQEVM